MATVADYPDGIGTPGPSFRRLVAYPIDYQVRVALNEDGGAQVNVQPCGPRKFQIDYEGITEANLATLRTHLNLAKGPVNDFSFYNRQTGTTIPGVHYESWRVGRHQKSWFLYLSVTLVVLE